ncbi:unnamed protein product, partial [Urochloa humidicola]
CARSFKWWISKYLSYNLNGTEQIDMSAYSLNFAYLVESCHMNETYCNLWCWLEGRGKDSTPFSVSLLGWQHFLGKTTKNREEKA